MKKVDARSLEAVHTHTHTHTHTVYLLTKVSLLSIACTTKLCLLSKMINKYNITKTEIELIYWAFVPVFFCV